MTGGLRSTEVARRLGLDGADVYRLLFVGELAVAQGLTGSCTSAKRRSTPISTEMASGTCQTTCQTNHDAPARTTPNERGGTPV